MGRRLHEVYLGAFFFFPDKYKATPSFFLAWNKHSEPILMDIMIHQAFKKPDENEKKTRA